MPRTQNRPRAAALVGLPLRLLGMLAGSKAKTVVVALTVAISLQHKRLHSGRYQYKDLQHSLHALLFLIRKSVSTFWKRVLGLGTDHHYWGFLDEVVVKTLGFAARTGHCTAPRKSIEAYEGVQRAMSKVVGHCCVSDIDLGLGRGTEDAVYIALSEEHVLGSVPIVLFYHGGGYVIGSSGMYINAQWCWLKRMMTESAQPCAVLSINYPLAPEVKYPENLHFAFRAYDAVLARGICPSRVVIAGDSAGGCMAMQVAKHAADVRLQSGDDQHRAVAGLVLVSPWVSHATDADSHEEHLHTDFVAGHEVLGDYSKAYAPEEHHDALGNPSISPLHEDEFDFLPSTMVTYGTREVFSDDIKVFIEKLRAHQRCVSVSVGADCPHIYPLLWPLFKEASDSSLSDIGDFCTQKFKDAAALPPWSDELKPI